MVDAQNGGDIARIIFREILDGDRRKFIAQSNDSDTGGGARDLRFRAWETMGSTLRKLFPSTRSVKRKRGSSTSLDVYVGRFHWMQNGREVSREALLEPPTDARPNESRVTRVHEYACFTRSEPEEGSGRLMALFVQKKDGTVWPFVITERSLEHEEWDPAVAEFLLSALGAPRASGNAAYGFLDFETGKKFVR